MIIEQLTLGPFMVNCYIVGDADSGDAVLVDTGDNAQRIIKKVESHGLKPVCIANTHAHVDHVGAVKEVGTYYEIGFHLHAGDKPVLEGLQTQSRFFGVRYDGTPEITAYLEDGAILKAGTIEMEVLHTPGHSPGGVCFHIPSEKVLFSGDTLFAGSIGRTDLPGGSFNELINSINEKLLVLPDDTVVYSGHGPESTIGREKLSNPFLQ